jgi:hypothetical protein
MPKPEVRTTEVVSVPVCHEADWFSQDWLVMVITFMGRAPPSDLRALALSVP